MDELAFFQKLESLCREFILNGPDHSGARFHDFLDKVERDCGPKSKDAAIQMLTIIRIQTGLTVPRQEPIMSNSEPADFGQTAKPRRTPSTPSEWLLEAARRVPFVGYAIGVVGLVAAAAIASGFVLGHWEYALFGAIAVFMGAVVLRIYAVFRPRTETVAVRVPILVILWVVVAAFVVIVVMGVIKLGIHLFGNPPATVG